MKQPSPFCLSFCSLFTMQSRSKWQLQFTYCFQLSEAFFFLQQLCADISDLVLNCSGRTIAVQNLNSPPWVLLPTAVVRTYPLYTFLDFFCLLGGCLLLMEVISIPSPSHACLTLLIFVVYLCCIVWAGVPSHIHHLAISIPLLTPNWCFIQRI